MEDLTGKQFGPYRIIAPLGEGGMAAVYKAYQPSMDRYVALKVLPRHFADDPQFIQRFEQEAKVLAKLQHPHILPVHDFGESEGYTYMVMPLISGGDLADLFDTEPFSLEEIKQIISQVGEALDYAHAQGVVHRDVKPSNILIDSRGNCLLTDFGLAKMVAGSSKLTSTGLIVGTPSYMSPEQGMGQPSDGRTDIYALGVILYELATGQVPFRAETPMAVVIKHIQDPLPPPSKLRPTIPEAIERVILKALAKKPEDRYATAGEMVKALQAAIAAQSASATKYTRLTDKTRLVSQAVQAPVAARPPVMTASQPGGQNHLMFWGVLSFLLVIVMAAAGWGVWQFSRPTPAVAPPPVQGQAAPAERKRLELPQATPPPPPTLVPTAQPPANQPPPQAPQPPSGQFPAPPPEALEACRGAVVGAACTAHTPRGAVSGSCQTPPGQQQLACIPAGGAPPGP